MAKHVWMCPCDKADKKWTVGYVVFFSTDLGVLCRWPPKLQYRQRYYAPWSISDERRRRDVVTIYRATAMQPRSAYEHLWSVCSTCSSVCQTRELWQKKQISAHILTPYERSIRLVFWHEEWWVGDILFYLNFWAKLTHLLQKRRFPIYY